MDEKEKRILSRLQNSCAKREYCEYDIRQKLERIIAKECPDGNSEEIISSLTKDKFIDNLRYASAFAREKASLSGWGSIKIRYALSAKRIPADIIDEALGEIDSEKASARLEHLVATKAKSLEGDPEKKLKLLKFALSRGYGYDEVRKVVDHLLG